MVRKLALALLSLAACFPGWVHALGLGDITLHSYLNQPLDADIPLISASSTDLDTLKVGLAPIADFQRLGVQYADSLRQLRFSVVRKGGNAYVKVTSEGDFREPFADFVVEVDWENGRVLRQYTLLVDPPSLVEGKPTMTRAPVASAPAPAAAAPAPAPAPSAPSAMTGAAAPGTYGPTQRNDTLWRIANRVRPDQGVTVDQAMLALLKANPEAFIGDNINRLKAGYVLHVPDRAAMTAVSAGAASAEVRRQYHAWRGTGKPAAAATTSAAAPSKGRLELLAPEHKAAGEAASGSGEGAAASGDQTKELAMAKEAAEAQRQENADLRSRISQLQEQIDNMKRIANLKDEQMAALQKQLSDLKGGQQAAAEQAPAAPAAETTPTAPTESKTPAATAEAPAAPKPAPVLAKPAPADQPNNPYAVKDFKPVDTAALPKGVVKHPFKPETPAVPATTAPKSEAVSFVDKMKAMAGEGWSWARANPMVSGGAAGVVVLLLFIMALARRRQAASAGFQESILQTPKPAPAPTEPAAAETQAPAADENKVEEASTSYLSDFAVSGMDTLQSDAGEADPLTEADVFLAYGRFQPAESMIKEAIEAEPGRVDLKAKLLEIYHAARNAEAFESQAQAYQADLQAEPEAWEKVADMGRELCPDSALFRGDAAPSGAAAEAEAPAEEFDFDLDTETASTEGPSDEMLDFDLGEMAPPAEEIKPAGEGEPNLAGDLANELSDIAETMTPQERESEEAEAFEFETAEPAEAQGEPETKPEAEAEAAEGGLLADVDEVGTKLDLARAYIDMGDPEGARSILDEVMEEGNDTQKDEAKELLSQIS